MRRWYEVLASASSEVTRCHKVEMVPTWDGSDGESTIDDDDAGSPDAKAKLTFFDIG